MWWPAALRRCPFHPGIAAQHHVCSGCANAYGLGDRGFFRVCPKAPEIQVALALMAEEPQPGQVAWDGRPTREGL